MSHVPWLSIIALLITVILNLIGFTYSYAVIGERVAQHDRQIIKLETQTDSGKTELSRITSTLERIDERLKYVAIPLPKK